MSRLTAAPMKPGGQALNGTFGVDPSPVRTATLGRTAKRNLPLAGLGVLLVVGCAIGFSSAWLRASGHQEVLVVSKGLSAGQVISPSDVRTVQLSVASGVASMPASDISQVIGRPVSSAVTPGTLLTESDVAQTTGPPSGRAVVGLALKPGQYPPGLAPGERVLVVFNSGAPAVSGSSATSDTNLANAPTEATVLEVESAPVNSSESLVVSIQLAEGDGATAASAASEGNVALAVISSGASS
jgi:SAF domain